MGKTIISLGLDYESFCEESTVMEWLYQCTIRRANRINNICVIREFSLEFLVESQD